MKRRRKVFVFVDELPSNVAAEVRSEPDGRSSSLGKFTIVLTRKGEYIEERGRANALIAKLTEGHVGDIIRNSAGVPLEDAIVDISPGDMLLLLGEEGGEVYCEMSRVTGVERALAFAM